MAGTAVNGAVPAAKAATASGVSADIAELLPTGEIVSRSAGGERNISVPEGLEKSANPPSAATSETQPAGAPPKQSPETRGSERKLTRLRSAAFSFANGVTRMHSRLRAATTGSVPAAAGHQTETSSAEPDVARASLFPSAGGPSSAATSAGNSVSGVCSAGDTVRPDKGSSDVKTLPGGVPAGLPPHRHLDKVDEGEEADVEQQQLQHTSSSSAAPVEQTTTLPDAELPQQEQAAGDNASPATTATRASVMSTDLGGFYRKLLGEDWQEQLKELNPDTNPLLAFDESENLEAAVAAAGAAGAPATLGGGGAAAAAGNELQLPDTYQGKMRQRIRRRDVSDKSRDISDQVADDLHFGQDEEPLITPEDIAVIREQAWIPAGEGVPHLSEMNLGYHRAWDIGKKGCLAVKVDGLWDSAVKGNKMRFFVMDGTDPESFLSFYSKSDLHAARGLQSERLGTLTAWDMRDGYWNYPKKKVFVKRSDVKKKKDCILEGFTAEFYDAMLLCIWEMCVQAATEQLKHQRRRERARRRQSLPLGLRAPSGERRRSQTPSGETRRVSAALLSYKNLPRGVSGVGGGGASSQSRKAGATKAQQEKITAQHREVMRQFIREGRALLARPITSRHAGAASRRGGGKGDNNTRLPSGRRKAAPDAGEQPQPEKVSPEGGSALRTAVAATPGQTAATSGAAAKESPAAAERGIVVRREENERLGEEGGERKSVAAYKVSFQETGAEDSGAAEAERLKTVAAVAAVIVKGRPDGEASELRGEGGRGTEGEDENDDVFCSPLGETVAEAAAEDNRGRKDPAEIPGKSHGGAPEVVKQKEQFLNEHVDKPATEAPQSADRTVVMSGGTAGRAEGRQGDVDVPGRERPEGDISDREKKAFDAINRKQGREEFDFEREPKAEIAGAETEKKIARQLFESDETAAAFFAGGDKESARREVTKAEQQGQTDSARKGERRTVHVVSRQAKIRSGGHPEEEVFDWDLNRNNSSSPGGLVERRRRSESSAAIGNQQKTAAAGGGGAAAALGRLFPWRKLGGGAANRKEEDYAQGKEKAAEAVTTGQDEAASAVRRPTAVQARAGRERDREAAFRGAVQEIMVADGVQWKPGRTTGDRRKSSAWSAVPETPSRRTTAKLPKHEQLNRLPLADPHSADTPLLTPDALSPRDSEAAKPMFG